ncbi:MAG: type 4a pilus biogenesis protein PilO [Firmicutes bacterium]|nr:type 4a pilus biogenesis protein PilO [Bacillota bacterium]
MLISSLSKREKHLLLFLLVVLIVVGGYYYLYRPLVLELNSLEDALKELEGSLGKNMELLERGKNMEAEWERVNKSYQRALNLLPTDKSVPTLILLLEEALADRDIDLQCLQWLETEEEEDLFVYSFQLGVRGGYGNIADFLESLQDFPRFVRPRAVSLLLDGVEDQVQAELLLEVFSIADCGVGD